MRMPEFAAPSHMYRNVPPVASEIPEAISVIIHTCSSCGRPIITWYPARLKLVRMSQVLIGSNLTQNRKIRNSRRQV